MIPPHLVINILENTHVIAENTECTKCKAYPLFDILLIKYFPAG